MAPIEIKEEKLANIITNLENIIKHKIEINKNNYLNLINNNILKNPEILFGKSKERYNLNINKLELLNPLNILKKGYSIVKKDNEVIKKKEQIKVKDLINITLNNGELKAEIKEVK